MMYQGNVRVIQEQPDMFTLRFSSYSKHEREFNGPEHISRTDAAEVLMKMQIPAVMYNTVLNSARRKGSGQVAQVHLSAEDLATLGFKQ